MNGYRARRFEEMITGKEKLSIEDFKKIQMDVMNIPAREFIKKIKKIKSSDPDIEIALRLLTEWDCNLTSDSIGGIIYEVSRYFIVKDIFEKGLGEELTVFLMGNGISPVLYNVNEFYGHDTVILLRLLDNPDSWWIQQVGGVEGLITRNLKLAVNWLRKNLGKSKDGWKWEKSIMLVSIMQWV